MHLRPRTALVAAVLVAMATAAQACPHHGSQASEAAVTAVVPPASNLPAARPALALVAWKPRAWSPAARSVAPSGLWVSRAPDGALGMPDPATLASQAMISRNDDTPVLIERFGDGTLSAHLDDRWANYAVVTIGKDGKPAWTCVSGRQGAAQFMTSPVIVPAPATVKREEK